MKPFRTKSPKEQTAEEIARAEANYKKAQAKPIGTDFSNRTATRTRCLLRADAAEERRKLAEKPVEVPKPVKVPGMVVTPNGLVREKAEESAAASDQPTRKAPAIASRIKPADVMAAVCEHLAVEVGDIFRDLRHPEVVAAREMIAYLCRTMTSASYPEIAVMMCKGSHATILDMFQRATGKLAGTQDFHDGRTWKETAERIAAMIDKRMDEKPKPLSGDEKADAAVVRLIGSIRAAIAVFEGERVR